MYPLHQNHRPSTRTNLLILEIGGIESFINGESLKLKESGAVSIIRTASRPVRFII
jgi:hypothetical protein